ncbi:DNA-processing protein DprA [Hydromonas duriensis]|uniref:DNA protecting protein DprA n=1 Tax=Hydromonas duriensis TaxID=1527608 RepID=A0A4R6YAE7_9BURK|nr:DNA-processing protein DprA [Hydromonas duriensis]TDR32539.1 DNA protecting protein DprA [Hydromonas duriensis]
MDNNDFLTDDELAAWLRLMATSGVGDMTAHVLLKAFGLPQSVFAQSYLSLTKVVSERVANALLSEPSEALKRQIDETLMWRGQPENHVVSLSCRQYPQHLLTTADPPAVLYVKGRLSLLNHNANLAVVGSRHATAQGVSNAEQFAQQLAAGGMNIISGLALGIDAAAHRGALAAFKANAHAGSTIAVIGTGCDIIYPARNRDLAHQVARDGVIVSEFPLGTKAMASNFPRRNRIISGLSQGVLVVEAALKSGSLITARQAAEQNREVFAIPGSIHSPLARGCHALIRQGAKLVETAQDVLEELQIVPNEALMPVTANSKALAPASDVQTQILTALGFDPCDLDTLAARTKLSIAELSSELMLLELDGRIEKRPGNVYNQRS